MKKGLVQTRPDKESWCSYRSSIPKIRTARKILDAQKMGNCLNTKREVRSGMRSAWGSRESLFGEWRSDRSQPEIFIRQSQFLLCVFKSAQSMRIFCDKLLLENREEALWRKNGVREVVGSCKWVDLMIFNPEDETYFSDFSRFSIFFWSYCSPVFYTLNEN